MRDLLAYLMSLSLDELRSLHIRSVLAACGGSKVKALSVLKIGKGSLYRYQHRDMLLRRVGPTYQNVADTVVSHRHQGAKCVLYFD